ncbi:MAG: hypothetical protein WD972_03760, partial [Candidatus Andersenbacteria bacterium]
MNTTAADLAEYYITGDSSIEMGDVVCLSNIKLLDPGGEEVTTQGVLRKCNSPNDPRLVGIISTNPGVTLGSVDSVTGNSDRRTLALAGRVPVKISTENGPVKIGDYLTSSSIPGVAMKASGFNNVIGMSLGNFDATTEGMPTDISTNILDENNNTVTEIISVNVGKVEVFINLGQRSIEKGFLNTLLDTMTDHASKFFNTVLKKVENGVAYLKGIVVETLTVGSPDKPSGITIFDKTTKQPYCLEIDNGEFVKTAGKCGEDEETQNSNTDTTSEEIATEETTTETTTDDTTETTEEQTSDTTTEETSTTETCSDGIQNQDETNIDEGGVCSSPDIIPPVITLNGEAEINLNINDTYTEEGAT